MRPDHERLWGERRRRMSVVMALATFVAGPPSLSSFGKVAMAAPAADPEREVEARTAFVAGRYQEAVELYARLYGETLHPVYLRNLGRCHQKLGNPDRAIDFFRDYLRKGRSIKAAERREIDGYIAEMEELRKQRSQAVPAAAPPATPAASPTAMPPASVASDKEPPPPIVRVARDAVTFTTPIVSGYQPAQPEPTPFYRRWWFWTAIGVVGAGTATAIVLSRSSGAVRPTCPAEQCL